MLDPTYLYALLVAFISGSHTIVQKKLLNLNLNYKTMMVINVMFFVLFGSIYAYYYRDTIFPDFKHIKTKHYIVLGLSILFATFITSILNYELLLRNDAYIVSGLTLMAPIFTVILAYFYLKEEITCKGLVGIALMLLGTWLIIQAKQDAEVNALL